ncbi:MAG: ribonuclease HII [Psittacicella sp.]
MLELTKNLTFIAGVDEAGAGCLAGDLVVAAVILDPNNPIIGLDDSKKLSEKKREELFLEIKEKALDYSIIHISPQEIDDSNILIQRMLGMKKSVEALKKIEFAIFDGNRIPDGIKVDHGYSIKGDSKFDCISAASILAKVSRDHKIIKDSEIYPQYQFEKHKGYGTKIHKEALEKYGPCKIHRLSYKPVKESIKV